VPIEISVCCRTLGDDLYSRQPTCQAVRAAAGHFLFICKPSSHPTIAEYQTGIELPELTKHVKHGRDARLPTLLRRE
jgi:hypothetical protein